MDDPEDESTEGGSCSTSNSGGPDVLSRESTPENLQGNADTLLLDSRGGAPSSRYRDEEDSDTLVCEGVQLEVPVVTGVMFSALGGGQSGALDVPDVVTPSTSSQENIDPASKIDDTPVKEPLQFMIDTDDKTPEVAKVMQEIKELAESLLFHWKTFPIILPPSITDVQPLTLSEDGEEKVLAVNFKDLFIAPTFDELELVSRDSKGSSKFLNESQLNSVRKMGEFDVNSVNFPGQVHRWRLSQLLQKGKQRAHATLLNDAALSLRLLIITAKNRFASHFFSVSKSVEALCTAVWQVLDILIGMPSTTAGDLDEKLHEEHTRFLVAELDAKSTFKREKQLFCDYVKDRCKELESEKHKTKDFRPPPIPYKFQTPKGTEIDLRLFNRDIMSRCVTELKIILETESKGWYIKHKDKIIAELKGRDLSYDTISNKVNASIKEEYLKRVFRAILSSEELHRIQPHIGELLVEQAKATITMQKSVNSVQEKLHLHSKQLETHLVKSYPVRSLIPAWMHEQLSDFRNEFIQVHQWAAHEEAIETLKKEELDQPIYFLQRDLTFMRDRRNVLQKELSRVKHPTREFTVCCRTWLPSNYVVKRHLYGETDVIPTTIASHPAETDGVNREEDEATFTVEKFRYIKTNTKYPFWRWWSYFVRTWAWTWNSMFFLGIVVPWCSPVSLRALFYHKQFIPDKELNRVNGTLCPKMSSATHTLSSRLRALWEHVRMSRAKFEAEPDTGFLGKSCVRHINRAWNYVCKGAMGSVSLVLGFTPICLITSLLSMLAAITAPIWMPIVTILVYLASVLFYDFNHPVPGNAVMYLFEAILYRFLFLGCIQPIAAIFSAIVALPLCSLGVILFGILRRGGRAIWDVFMFHAVIKTRARVPSRNTFIARRITGPGLASHYFYQIHPEQVLAAVEAQMELYELDVWSENVAEVINEPKVAYKKFVSSVFSPFSTMISEFGVYRAVTNETSKLIERLNEEQSARIRKLNTGLTSDIRSRIKLSGRELKVVKSQTAKMMEGFYQRRIFPKMTIEEEDFWESKKLEEGDWNGLAGQLLSDLFSQAFLTPLEDTDTCFKLEVQHLNLSRYVGMLKSAEFRDDLDVVNTVHTPKGDIDVDAPYFDVHNFRPSRHEGQYAEFLGSRRRNKRKPWKKKKYDIADLQNLQIPLPIPHPGIITLLVHNRENEGQDQIDLEDIITQRILRSCEGMTYTTLSDVYPEEVSTPDYTTNSSDDFLNRHYMYSDDNYTTSASSPTTGLDRAAQVTIELAPHGERVSFSREGSGSVIYKAPEVDTSCVEVDMGAGEGGARENDRMERLQRSESLQPNLHFEEIHKMGTI